MSAIDSVTDADLDRLGRYFEGVFVLCKKLTEFFDDWGPVVEDSMVGSIRFYVKDCERKTVSMKALFEVSDCNAAAQQDQVEDQVNIDDDDDSCCIGSCSH